MEKPTPAAGQVLVKNMAIATNPIDYKAKAAGTALQEQTKEGELCIPSFYRDTSTMEKPPYSTHYPLKGLRSTYYSLLYEYLRVSVLTVLEGSLYMNHVGGSLRCGPFYECRSLRCR